MVVWLKIFCKIFMKLLQYKSTNKNKNTFPGIPTLSSDLHGNENIILYAHF